MNNAKYALSMARRIGAPVYALPEDLYEVKMFNIFSKRKYFHYFFFHFRWNTKWSWLCMQVLCWWICLNSIAWFLFPTKWHFIPYNWIVYETFFVGEMFQMFKKTFFLFWVIWMNLFLCFVKAFVNNPSSFTLIL